MKIEMNHALCNQLVDKFQERAEAQGFKGKKKLQAQAEFFLGAVSVIDCINGNPEKSCISPNIYFSIMRGDEIKKFETNLN